MSAPKRRSPPFNLQLVSDKEVAISLERLIDSVVMETTAHRSALQSQQVNESNDNALGINSLPDEIIEVVFGYLTQNQLGQIASVCRRWNALAKSPVLWKKVNVKFLPSHRCQTTVVESFINGLPSCVASIRLHFSNYRAWAVPLDFEQLCLRLQEKCPHLEELILIHSVLPNSLSSVIDLCNKFLQYVKKLNFHYSKFPCDRSTDECFGISKIEILEFLYCYFDCSNKPPFSKMPNLKQLYLCGTNVDNSWFEDEAPFLHQLHVLNVGYSYNNFRIFSAIQNHGHNLKELYLCSRFLLDVHLTFTDSAFPHLKTICLSCTRVT